MTLAYLGGLMKAGSIRNALIVAPLSVLRSWEKEANDVLVSCVPAACIQVLSSDIGKSKRRNVIRGALEW